MKVLIAEDDVVLQRLLRNNLQKWGHEVASAENGEEALDLFEKGDYPLVITDWMMPRMDGLELVRRIRESPRPGYVYTIMLTAKSQKEDLIDGMDAGADDFISKPFDRDELRVRLRAGERILELHQELIQSERLAGLGQMAAGLAGEIDEPITFLSRNTATLRRDIMTFMRLLNKYREGSADLAKVRPDLAAEIDRIEDETHTNIDYFQSHLPRQFKSSLDELQQIRDILNKLRDFAQTEEAEVREADINAALESIIEVSHYETKRKQITIKTEFGELPPVVCRPGKINQAFLQLMVNAIQACEPEGLIQIRTRFEPAAVDAGAGTVIVEFEDNGSGIPEEHLSRLFDPFFTTKPGGASGLGLSVSYGIVRDHGGTIEVASSVGNGSIFRVRLPVRPATAGIGEPGIPGPGGHGQV